MSNITAKLVKDLRDKTGAGMMDCKKALKENNGSLDKAIEWRKNDINIQINLNSLSGQYGPEIKKQAEKLIDAGEFDFVGTDCHRIEHLMLLEDNLRNPYMHKIGNYLVKNLVI